MRERPEQQQLVEDYLRRMRAIALCKPGQRTMKVKELVVTMTEESKIQSAASNMDALVQEVVGESTYIK